MYDHVMWRDEECSHSEKNLVWKYHGNEEAKSTRNRCLMRDMTSAGLKEDDVTNRAAWKNKVNSYGQRLFRNAINKPIFNLSPLIPVNHMRC